MDAAIVIHQALLYAHIIFFALSLATILREDCRLMLLRRIDPAAIRSTAKTIKWLLLALWTSGLLMLAIDIGHDGSALLSKPKLVAKLAVVSVLTLNGVLLHLTAFPMLMKPQGNPRLAARVAATLGAVSTTSWLYASFLGVARLVAPYLSLGAFLATYVLALAGAVAFALVLVSGRLERMMLGRLDQGCNRDRPPKNPRSDRRGLCAVMTAAANKPATVIRAPRVRISAGPITDFRPDR